MSNNSFDLNNPPKVAYVHQEFPRVMYGAEGATKIVSSQEDREAAEAAGFSVSPNVEKPVSKKAR